MPKCLVGVVGAVLILVGTGANQALSQASSDDVAELLQSHKQSVVKIKVSGRTPTNTNEISEGSGFVVYSADNVVVIVTAAHVLKADHDWAERADGSVDRNIQVSFLNDSEMLFPHARILERAYDANEQQDWAILLTNGKWEHVLKRGNSLRVPPGSHGLLIGYPQGGDVPQPTPLIVQAPDIARHTLLGVSAAVPPGNSGGPILDAQGLVVGIASEHLRDDSGSHRAVPINNLTSALSDILGVQAAAATLGTSEQWELPPIEVAGTARLTLSGSGGGDLRRPVKASAGIGKLVRVEGDGGERSDCDAGFGRSISGASGVALIQNPQAGKLAFDFQRDVRGGHFRRAAGGCIRTLKRPLGIIPQDTRAVAQGRAEAAVRVPVDPNQVQGITVRWTDMPANGATLEILTPSGNRKSQQAIAGSGEITLPVDEIGTYEFRPKLDLKIAAHGSSGRNALSLSPTLMVDRTI
jgi:S1-C subfamily serine protease